MLLYYFTKLTLSCLHRSYRTSLKCILLIPSTIAYLQIKHRMRKWKHSHFNYNDIVRKSTWAAQKIRMKLHKSISVCPVIFAAGHCYMFKGSIMFSSSIGRGLSRHAQLVVFVPLLILSCSAVLWWKPPSESSRNQSQHWRHWTSRQLLSQTHVMMDNTHL